MNLSNLDTSKVTDMNNMFYNVPLVTLNLSNWSNDKITDMSTMLVGKTTLKTLKLNNFKTTNVTNMHAMFASTTNLKYVNVGKNGQQHPLQLTICLLEVEHHPLQQASVKKLKA